MHQLELSISLVPLQFLLCYVRYQKAISGHCSQIPTSQDRSISSLRDVHDLVVTGIPHYQDLRSEA